MKRFKKLSALLVTSLLTTSLFTGCGNSNIGVNGTINFFNVGDYIDEFLIRDFEKQTGIKVNYDTYDTNEIMYQKLKTNPGTYDLVVPSDYMVQKMISEDMVENACDYMDIHIEAHSSDQTIQLDKDGGTGENYIKINKYTSESDFDYITIALVIQYKLDARADGDFKVTFPNISLSVVQLI